MIIDDRLLDEVTEKAYENPRLRMNHNLHDSLEAKAQRLINVLLPGTVVPIHRHRDTAETNIILRGRLAVIFYNDQAEETGRHLLDPTIGNYAIHIPTGQWHTVEVLAPSAILEVKEGPYAPLSSDDIIL